MTQNAAQNALLVTADREVSHPVISLLARTGLRAVLVKDVSSARQKLDLCPWRLVVVDAQEDASTMGLLTDLRTGDPELPVFALCPNGDLRQAVRAMQAGATDVLERPLDAEALEKALGPWLPSREVDLAAAEEEDQRCMYRIAGSSDALRRTLELGRKVAASTAPVLITGESGTGKELLAYLVHRASARQKNPYVRVNCAALSESLMESELFGHERGAFTGAHEQRKGRFELAHRGTLLLDEISETSDRLQAELLRVLEQQDFERVGGSESVNVNVRVVCTSNRPLGEEVRRGKFRADLYYRIHGVHLHMPALRERIEDIPELVWHFVNLYAGETGRQITNLDGEMLRLMESCPWPGNVRQLRNVVRAALILGTGSTLNLDGMDELQRELRQGAGPAATACRTLSLQDLERQAILEALKRTNSHQAKAARMLGISDRTLRDKLRRYREDGQLETDDDKTTGEDSWLAHRAS